MRDADPCSRPPRAGVALVMMCGILAACAGEPTKDDVEAAKNSFACSLRGERLVVRLDLPLGEARLLMPDGDRVVLHQIPTATGVRYSNGTYELRGKGMDLQFIREGTPIPIVDCQPFPIPK